MFQYDNDEAGAATRTGSHGPAISVADILQRLWRVRWAAVVGAILCIAAAFAFYLTVKPTYEASAQVYIDPQDLKLLRNDLNPALTPGDSGVVIIESQTRIMESAAVLRRVVEKLDLTSDPEFVGKPNPVTAFLRGLLKGPSKPSDKVQVAADALGKSVHVVRADRTYVIEVYARSHDAQKSADIANAVVSAYLELREQARADQAGVASQSLEDRLAGLRDNVQKNEEAVEDFKAKNNIVGTNGSLLVENRLSDANKAVSAAEEAMDQAKAQLDQLTAMKNNPTRFLSSAEALKSTDVSRLRGDLERAQASIGNLSATLGPRHPQRLAAQSQLDAINRSIGQEIQRLQSNAQLAYDRAKTERTAAAAQVSRLSDQLKKMDSLRVHLRQLERDAQSSREVYEEALLRTRETREQGKLSTINVQVVSQATAPLKKKFPPSLKILLPLALMMGAGLGAALGMARGALASTPPSAPSSGTRALERFARIDRGGPVRPAPAAAAPAGMARGHRHGPSGAGIG